MLDLTELRAASDSWPLPAHDLETVKERARVLMRRRRVVTYGFTALFLVAVIAVGLTWSRTLGDDNFQVRPAGETQEGARAATFAFHALLETTEYSNPTYGPYDYKTVEQISPTQWLVHFKVGADPEEIAAFIEGRKRMLSDGPRLSSESKEDIRQEIAEFEKVLDDALAAGGPFNYDVTVEINDGRLSVRDVTGESPDTLEQELMEYSEPLNAGFSQGTEYWGVRYKGGEGNFVGFEASTFWTGPIPSSYREKCLLSLMDESGRTVFTQQESGPHGADISTAPDSEDMRDWGIGNSGGRLPERLVDRDDLTPRVDCHPLEAEGWVTVGDAGIESAKRGETYPWSTVDVTPNTHVLVSSDVVYKGEPGIQSICIARVYDEEGDEISSHGQTIYERELRLIYGSVSPLRIPVGLDNPENANFASMTCQPTVPGVNLGPDQED